MNGSESRKSELPSEAIPNSPVPAADEFLALFLADQRRIHGYIITLLACQQDAEDLLQETAALLWRRFNEFERGTNFFAWACKTAHLIVLGYRRRKGREAAILSDAAFEKLAASVVEENDLLAARTTALEDCLGKLKESDRRLLERCYAPGAKSKQVATELGRPVTSVYISLGRIRRMLAECIRRTLALAERQGNI